MTDLDEYGFHKRFDPEAWRDHVCVELEPLIAVALREEGAAIAGLGLVDVKMPYSIVVLDRPAGDAVMKQFTDLSAAGVRLRWNPGCILCEEHYASVQWSLPPVESPVVHSERSIWQRFRAWLSG